MNQDKTILLDNGLRLGYSSDLEMWRADTFFTKEPETISWIDHFKNEQIFFDVGANIGAYANYAAFCNEELQVFAFEPIRKNFEIIQKNKSLNNLKNLSIFEIGISNENKLTKIYLSDTREGNSGAQLDKPVDEKGQQFIPKEVETTMSFSLDYLIYDLDFPCPNFLKIDVDGFEDKIIDGSRRLFEDNRLKSLLIEINASNEESEIHKILESSNFILDDFFNTLPGHSSNRRSKNPENIALNCIYSRPEYLVEKK